MLHVLVVALCMQASDPAAIEDELRRAKNEYAFGRYEYAIKLLHDLLYPMRLSTDEQVIEARKYLALSYYLLDRLDDVGEEFAKLLHLDPDYELDPYTVAPPVIEMFESVRRKLKPELDVIRQLRSDRKLQEPARPGVDREIERRFTEHSGVGTFLPFGVGQFQNGQPGWGMLFAVTEVLLLAVNIGAWTWAVELRRSSGTYSPANRPLMRALLVTQYAALAAFGVTWSLGVMQARLNFTPVVEAPQVIREVPKSASLPISGGALSFTLQF